VPSEQLNAHQIAEWEPVCIPQSSSREVRDKVVDWLLYLARRAERARDRLKNVMKLTDSQLVVRQYLYWDNAGSALRWAAAAVKNSRLSDADSSSNGS
jgi:hypothetical protein